MSGFGNERNMIRYACIRILFSFFVFSGIGSASLASAEQERDIAVEDFPPSPFWPPYAGDSLGGLGSLEYEIPGQDSPNVQKITIRPKLLDDEAGWFYETYYIDIFLDENFFSKDFYAAHGKFQASVPINLWGERHTYVFLIRQITKGTGVSEHELDIFEAKNGVVRTVVEKKIAGYFDFFGNLWRYKLYVTPTEIGPTNSFYGLELQYERDFAGEKFVREGFVAKDAAYGQDMPKVICIIYHEETLHEYEGKRCRDIRELE